MGAVLWSGWEGWRCRVGLKGYFLCVFFLLVSKPAAASLPPPASCLGSPSPTTLLGPKRSCQVHSPPTHPPTQRQGKENQA